VVEQARSFGGRKITFGLERNAEVYVSGRPAWSMSGVRFTLVTPLGRAEVRLKLLGRHNLVNALAAAAAATAMSIGPEDVAAGLAQLGPHPGRLELKRLPGPIYVLDDTYNANPVSAAAAMSVLRSLSRGKGRKVAVFGDMLELGAHSRFEHDLLGRGAAASKLDLLAAVGPESKATAKAAVKHGLPKKSVAWFDDAAQAAEWLNQRLQPNDRVLVKGSRGMKMESVVRRLAEGGRA
jgi:UDP-N-acetylmuramoyl-tripeptide--D-alanyl-D-alanine ligase